MAVIGVAYTTMPQPSTPQGMSAAAMPVASATDSMPATWAGWSAR